MATSRKRGSAAALPYSLEQPRLFLLSLSLSCFTDIAVFRPLSFPRHLCVKQVSVSFFPTTFSDFVFLYHTLFPVSQYFKLSHYYYICYGDL